MTDLFKRKPEPGKYSRSISTNPGAEMITLAHLEKKVELKIRRNRGRGPDSDFEIRKARRVVDEIREEEQQIEIQVNRFGWWPCKNPRLWARAVAQLGRKRYALIEAQRRLEELERCPGTTPASANTTATIPTRGA